MNQSLALSILMQAQDNASAVFAGLAANITQMLSGAISPMALVSVGLIAMGAAAIGFGIAAVGSAASFQQIMLKNMSLAGLSKQQFDSMSASILGMSSALGQSPQQLAQGLYFVLSAGVPAANAMDVLKLSAMAAATGMTDTKTVADGLTSAMNAFQVPWSQATNVMADLTATVTNGKMEWANLAAVIGIVSVTAHESGISLQEASAALATLTDSGLSAQRASMDLNFLMRDVGINASKVAKAAQGMGLSFDLSSFQSMNLMQKLQYLQQITGGNEAEMLKLSGGATGMAAAMVLLANKGELYNSILGKITQAYKAGDATQKAFAITQQGLNQQLAQLSAAWQTLLIIVGTYLLPVLAQLAGWLTGVVSAFAQLLDGAGPIIDFFQSGSLAAYALGAALGGLAIALGVYLVTLIPGMIAGLLDMAGALWAVIAPVLVAAAPFILIGLAIAGVIAILIALYNNLSGVRDLVNLVVDALKTLWNVLVAKVTAALQAVWTWIQVYILPALQLLWNWIVNYIVAALQQFNDWLENSVIPTLQAFGRWIQNTVVPALQTLYNWIANQIVSALQTFWNWIQTYITPALQGFWNWIQTRVVPALQTFWNMLVNKVSVALQDIAKWIQNTVVPALQGFWNWIQTHIVPALQGFWNMLVNKVSIALQDIAKWIQNTVVPALQNFWNWIQTQLVPALQGFWNMLVNKVSVALQDIAKWIQNTVVPALQGFWNWIQTQLIPALQNLWGWLQTKIGGAIQAVAGWVQNTLIPSIQGIVSWVQTQLVPALQNAWNWLTTIVGNIVKWAQQNDVLGKTAQMVWLTLQQLWQVLAGQLGPILSQLWTTIQTQLVPAWNGLVKAIQPLLPLLLLLLPNVKQIAEAVGILLVGYIGLLVGALSGAITFLGMMLRGLIQAFGGIAQLFAGLMQTISGIVMFIVDLCTLQFGNLGADLTNIWQGIVLMFKGLWNIIVGIFTASIGALVTAVWAFITNIITYFQNLYNVLVGHSIIPDLMTAIIANFTGMIAQVGALVASFMSSLQTGWNNLLAFFNAIAGSLTTAIVNPFKNAVTAVLAAMSGLASSVGNIVSGIISNIGNIGSSIGGAVSGVHIPGFASGVTGFAGGLAVVGEWGPEVVRLPGGSDVIPNHKLSSIGGGGGGVTHNHYTNYVTVNAPAMSRREADTLATEVAKSLNGRYRTQLGGIATGGSNI